MCVATHIRQLTARVREVGEIDPAETAELFERVRVEAPGLAPEDIELLKGLLADFEKALHEGQARVQERLRHSGRGRRAMKGYGYVRSHKRGQRVRKKA